MKVATVFICVKASECCCMLVWLIAICVCVKTAQMWGIFEVVIPPVYCHGRVAGRTRETSGKRNNGTLMTEHRIHNHIDELTDKDSGKTQGLWTHNTIKGNSIRWGANQTQMGMNELMTGNRKDHIRVWKHKEKEDKVWHYPPLAIGASRVIRHRKGRGGWALWRPQRPGDRTGGLQGGARSGTHGGSGDSGGHGGSGDSGGHGGAGCSGGHGGLGGHGGSGDSGGHGGAGSLGCLHGGAGSLGGHGG